MASRINKKHYMNRGLSGEEITYRTPDDLIKKAYEYFIWCDKNPWDKTELMKSGDKKGELVGIPIGRPYTLIGLCVYCGISEKTYELLEKDDDFCNAANHIKDIITQNQIEGISIGAYNSSLMTRMDGTKKNELKSNEITLSVKSTDPKTVQNIETMKAKLNEKDQNV